MDTGPVDLAEFRQDMSQQEPRSHHPTCRRSQPVFTSQARVPWVPPSSRPGILAYFMGCHIRKAPAEAGAEGGLRLCYTLLRPGNLHAPKRALIVLPSMWTARYITLLLMPHISLPRASLGHLCRELAHQQSGSVSQVLDVSTEWPPSKQSRYLLPCSQR